MADGSGPSVVDLFCGAGGLSEGLRQAGFIPKVGLDFDKHAAATYRHNHSGVPVIEKDIASVTGVEILELAGTDQIDLIAGGPSCQGFICPAHNNESSRLIGVTPSKKRLHDLRFDLAARNPLKEADKLARNVERMIDGQQSFE